MNPARTPHANPVTNPATPQMNPANEPRNAPLLRRGDGGHCGVRFWLRGSARPFCGGAAR